MKKIFTILCMVGISLASFGQYFYLPSTTNPGNPGNNLNGDSEFPVAGGLDPSWTSILTGNNVSPAWSSTETIPFSFRFNGSIVTQYKVSSSGVLTFTTSAATAPAYANAAIPDASIPDQSVMVWGVEGTGANDEIVTKTFGTSGSQQHWIFFASYTAGGSWSYWSIVLEEGSDNIYIVDQRHSAAANPAITAGIQIDGSTAISVAGSPSLGGLAGTDATPADNYYYNFIYGTQAANDFAGVSVDVEPYVSIEIAPIYLKGTITNWGTNTINDFRVRYSIDGGSPKNMSVNQTLNTNDSYTFTHGTGWTPPSTGTYTIEIWADNLNGNADDNTSNDKASAVVEVVDVIKRPFIEDFGSSTCPPCAALMVSFDPLLLNNEANRNNGKVTAVKYEMNWPPPGDDPYYNPDGVTRRNYYSVTGIPDTWINGTAMSNTTQTGIDQEITEGFMKIDATYSISGNQVNASVTVDPLVDFTSNNLRLHMVVVEDYYSYTGGTTSQTDYYQVQRKMLPDGNGTSIGPLTGGTPVTVNESYTFTIGGVAQGNHNIGSNMGNLSLVAFVQDQSTMEVHQSTSAYFATAINEVEFNTVNAKLFPNPTADNAMLMIGLEEQADLVVEVYNTMGQKVHSENLGTRFPGSTFVTLEASDWAKGMYVVHIAAGENTITKKLSVN